MGVFPLKYFRDQRGLRVDNFFPGGDVAIFDDETEGGDGGGLVDKVTGSLGFSTMTDGIGCRASDLRE